MGAAAAHRCSWQSLKPLAAVLTASRTYHVVPKQLQQPARDDANYLLHPLQGTVLLSALLMLCHASHKLTWDILNVGLISVCTGLQAWQLIAVPVFNSLLVTIDGGPMHKLTRAASILRAPPQ